MSLTWMSPIVTLILQLLRSVETYVYIGVVLVSLSDFSLVIVRFRIAFSTVI